MNIKNIILLLVALVLPLATPQPIISEVFNVFLFIGLVVVYLAVMLSSTRILKRENNSFMFIIFLGASWMLMSLTINAVITDYEFSVFWAVLKILIWLTTIPLLLGFAKQNWETFLPISLRILQLVVVVISLGLYLSLINSDVSRFFAGNYGLSYAEISAMLQYYNDRPSSFLGNPNFLGVFSAFCFIVLSMSEANKQKLNVLLLSFLICNILLSRSRTALIILMVFIILNLFYNITHLRKGSGLGFLFLFIMITFAFFTLNSTDIYISRYISNINLAGREQIWFKLIEEISALEILLGSYGNYQDGITLDSDYLFVLYFSGFIGVFLLCLMYVRILMSVRFAREVVFFMIPMLTASLALSLISTTKMFLPTLILLTISFCLAFKRINCSRIESEVLQ
ncbi:hypothetical protein ACFOD1_02950 [Pseudidiomarina halophila]|uniref:Uncharacterized protein n=1 Tax=Pseudidiomarina halophila TaxID=1449799 RepID=A0A432XYX1_9GAMM|nr:hypothetical protein [Pseudidiomarina halophila]RUO53916.1 hypothetical protein CWI69_00290 [Pseudidiomarina halophila]